VADSLWGVRLSLASFAFACRLLEGPLAGPLAALQRRSTTHSDLRTCFPLQLCRNRCLSSAGTLSPQRELCRSLHAGMDATSLPRNQSNCCKCPFAVLSTTC